MNTYLKSALFAVGAMGAMFASAANAEPQFNVTIDTIEMVTDADNYPNTATIVYQPRANVGSSATKTVDLFGSAGTNGSIHNLAQPNAGTYETVIVFFEKMEVVSDTTVDLTALPAAGGLRGVSLFSVAGRYAMVLGAGGAGATSVDTVIMGGAGGELPMQPVTVTGTNSFSLPNLNMGLASSAVVDNAGTTSLSAVPAITVIGTTSDAAGVPDVEVAVDSTAFAAVPNWNDGASRITVGLFTVDIPEKPIQYTRYTSPSTAGITEVVFNDLFEGNVYPIAWIDADADNELDAGEYYTAHSAVITANAVPVPPATPGTAIANVSATVELTDVLDEVAAQKAPRVITVTMEAANAASTTMCDPATNDDTGPYTGIEFTGANAPSITGGTFQCHATNSPIVLTTTVTSCDGNDIVLNSFDIDGTAGVSTGAAAGTIEAGDNLNFVILDADASTALNIPNVTFVEVPANESADITIANVPVCATDLNTTVGGSYRFTLSAAGANVGAWDQTALSAGPTEFDTPVAVAGDIAAFDSGAVADVGVFD